MLRIFVFGLILANILLISLHFLRADAGDNSAAVENPTEISKLPRIELIDTSTSPESRSFPRLEEELEQAPEQAPEQVPEQIPVQIPVQVPEQVPEQIPDSAQEQLASAQAESGPLMCVRLGPFESETELTSLQPELERQFEQVQRRETELLVEMGYWVFLPPYTTREEAENGLERLTAAGVKDYYVIPQGNMANAISLGVYELMDRAESRRRQLVALGLGLEFEVQPRSEMASQYWLEAGPADELSPAWIQWSLSHPDTGHMQIPCSPLIAEAHPAVREEDAVPEFVPATNSLEN